MAEKLNTEQLMGMLALAKNEEIEIRSAIRSTMNQYITLLTTIPAGIIAISSLASLNPVMFAVTFIVGGVMEIVLSVVAVIHFRSDYRRQAESIVTQAKLEDMLELDTAHDGLKRYWTGESLLPESYVRSRERFKHSDDFIAWFINHYDMRTARWLYGCFTLAGVVFVILGIVL